jgi:uncharacterized protein (TIGR02117 family)
VTKEPLLLFLLLCILVGCTAADGWRHMPATPDDAVRIVVVQHGWHTGIVVPQSLDRPPFQSLQPHFSESPYYEFGWGDRDYYMGRETGPWGALKAGLWPTASVMHIVAMPQPPHLQFADADQEELLISYAGYLRLLQYFSAHFTFDDQGRVIALQPGLYGNSLFFEAQGRFHLARTCNTWTAQALNAAGVPMRTFMTVTAGSVLNQVRKAREQQTFSPAQLP